MIVLLCLVLVVLIAYLVIKLHPPLGARATAADRIKLESSVNRHGGKFVYPLPTPMNMPPGTMLKVMGEMIKGSPNRKPRGAVPMNRLGPRQLKDRQTQAIWFGHSAFLLKLGGLTLLLDPMFGKAPSPFPFIGGKRYGGKLPFDIDELPEIDAVILSHDHYDHLDYGSIRKLRGKVKQFIVPLGVGAHLVRWGIARDRIVEADWWDELAYEGLKLACAPARHFSGRSVNDRYATLWCSWVIESEEARIYFSGDSGYGPHFKQIGEKYGPFDLTLMECGQYDTRWHLIHMLPEETVQAHQDVGGKLMLPIHWGAFTLALHDWTDPIERVLKAAAASGVTVTTPRIGQSVPIGSSNYPSDKWWK
ncbi:MBL fold metallo-hydrolase [Cohnella panacarvi]|uniref:MBL fold metallo-hydrolase n=1 Tax=Cohnella panacarvi TaxID=400776 RepID=UPI00047B84A5|nr:MBL fold metallo-hydrolase [Cohnella panacarvi]